ncbi:hypothetical protein [Radicibacter daui]|uniref:hypothetical protein n=1 Tax=Radicibacter daui TaxID=3064829 RepID=UPI004046AE99
MRSVTAHEPPFKREEDLERIIEICSRGNAYILVINMGEMAGCGQIFVKNGVGNDFTSAGIIALELMRSIVRHPRFYRDGANAMRWRLSPPG